MPEAVSAFSQGASLEEVRTIQKNILDSYDNDFSKHAPTEMVPRIKQLLYPDSPPTIGQKTTHKQK
jgi:hypothetical protein